MLELRPYQQKTISALREGFKAGHRAQMLYMPTGSGKTESSISILLATKQAGNNCAMVLDRRILCEQTSQRLDKYGIEHGVLMAGHANYRPSERIQICSAQTLEARGSFPDLKLLIVDEAHTVRSETASFIKNTQARVIGLSASPFTKGLGSIYSNVVSEVTTKDLVENLSLVPLRVFLLKEIDMTGAKRSDGEWTTRDVTERGVKITGDVVKNWEKVTLETFGEAKKTIVFSAGVEHGASLADEFNRHGYNFVSLSYKDDDEYKSQVIEEFGKKDSSIVGLIATDILTKGFDSPNTMIGVSARPFSKSFSSHVQQLGRVMRPYPGKEFAVWIDHSGNYLRFRDDWDDVFCNGVSELHDGKERPKPEPTKEEKEASKCPKCGGLWPKHSDTCSFCGFVRERKSTIEVVPGELCELEAQKELIAQQQEVKKLFYYQLIQYARNRGFSEWFAYYKFKEKFGVFPRFRKPAHDESFEITREVAGWIKSRQIAYTKARNKYA